MKSVKFTLSIFVLFAFLGLNEAIGQWATSGTNIYNTNSGFVGVGTSTPGYLFHVSKNMTAPSIRIHNAGGSGGAAFEMVDNFSGADWKFKATNAGGFKIRDHANSMDVIQVEPNSAANALYIDINGDVALGHALPDGHGLNARTYTSGKGAVYGTDQSGTSIYAIGMLGVLSPGTTGAPLAVTNAGVFGIKPNLGGNGAAIYGWNNDDNTNNYGGVFIADGPAGSNQGIYSYAKFGTTNFAGQFEGRVEVDGHSNSTDAADYLSTVFTSTVNHTLSSDTRAVEGISQPADGFGIGVQGTGGYKGVQGIANGGAYTGFVYGVIGSASGSAGTRIGVYGSASGGTTANWAGYFSGDCYISSDLRIGTTTQATGYSLSVNGKVACTEVLVDNLANWPDYVFADNYNLMSLEELEESIEKNNHLPGIPSAAEVEENGIMLGDMQKRMMEKIEELTLYTIAQNKKVNELQDRMEDLEKENARLRENSNR